MFLMFQGTSANSEPETKAIASTIQQFKNNIRIYMSFHSFGKSKSYVSVKVSSRLVVYI